MPDYLTSSLALRNIYFIWEVQVWLHTASVAQEKWHKSKITILQKNNFKHSIFPYTDTYYTNDLIYLNNKCKLLYFSSIVNFDNLCFIFVRIPLMDFIHLMHFWLVTFLVQRQYFVQSAKIANKCNIFAINYLIYFN